MALASILWVLAVCPLLTLGARHCTPADRSCWPTDQQLSAFATSLSGKMLRSSDAGFKAATDDLLANRRFANTLPALLVYVANTEDVAKCLQFAQNHNIEISVLSSGHSYIGTSTAEDSLQINLSALKDVTTNTSDPTSPTGASAWVDSGSAWKDTYQMVDKVNRLIVGGSAPTVSAGGYTLGGGHSPMSRSLGLAVDNVLEMKVVLADGSVRLISETGQKILRHDGTLVSENKETDLFWALRGGGGGTYGVVTSFKFKLHTPPVGFVHLITAFPYLTTYAGNVGEPLMDFIQDFMKNVSSNWGGYVLVSQTEDPNLTRYGIRGSVTLSLLHFGEYTDQTRQELEQLKSYQPKLRFYFTVTNHSTFWSYQKGVNDPRGYTTYLANTLQQVGDLNENVGNTLTKIMNSNIYFGCTFVMLGGKMKDYSYESSSISQEFRDARTSLSCGIGMASGDYQSYQKQINAAQPWARQIASMGHGMYYNEPDERRTDWRTANWGGNYPRLLGIKQKYDPKKVFTCLHCVGWEEPTTTPAPGTTRNPLLQSIIDQFRKGWPIVG